MHQEPIIKVGTTTPDSTCKVNEIHNDGVVVEFLGGTQQKMSFSDVEKIFTKN